MNRYSNSKATPSKDTGAKNKTNNNNQFNNVGTPSSGILKPTNTNKEFPDDRPRRDGPGGE